MATVSRMFDDFPSARLALNALVAGGIPESDISLVANNGDDYFADKSRVLDRDDDGVDDRAEGAGAGDGLGAQPLHGRPDPIGAAASPLRSQRRY